jgi:hypothetical protein
MNNTALRIRFPDTGSGAELEVVAPARSDTEARIWHTLDALFVGRGAAYVVRTGVRLIASVSLTERDGARLSPRRAGQVLQALRVGLAAEADTGTGRGRERTAAPTQWSKTGTYPRVEPSAARIRAAEQGSRAADPAVPFPAVA